MNPLVSTAPLVSTQWLAAHLDEVRVVDASWYMPDEKREPAREFEAGHIPGAVFFDIDAIADHATDLPHMMPAPDAFARAVSALGIGDSDIVVVYDGTGIFSAPRAWWALRVMGHEQVFVLDGGLPKWRAEGRPVAEGNAAPVPALFHARPVAALARDYGAVLAHLAAGDAQIIDARSHSRFSGEEKEPRAGLKSGHMPGAVNLPWRMLLAPDNTLKDDEALRRLFAEKGIDMRAPIVTTCGSGISAAILMLALARTGAAEVALYDGSWAEWGGRDGAPMVTGMSPSESKRRVPMTVTFFEMLAKPAVMPPPSPKGRHAILRAEAPAAHFYRYLYDTIGASYLWVDRRKLSPEALSAIIQHPLNQLYVLYTEGSPAGMAELDFRKEGSCNIAYFGLMPEAIGKHLGYFFLYHTCQNAWARPIGRLTVNTCTLDHPRALPLYQRMGFSAYSREERFVELP